MGQQVQGEHTISSRSRLPLAIANLVGYLVVVIVNVFATSIPLGGMTTGELSDLYPNLFVPAGLTFSIRGVIYLLLGMYVVCGITFSTRKQIPENGFMEKIALVFLVSCRQMPGGYSPGNTEPFRSHSRVC